LNDVAQITLKLLSSLSHNTDYIALTIVTFRALCFYQDCDRFCECCMYM